MLYDCSKALTFNPNNIKAYYRSVKALLALDKMEEGIDCCQRGLRLDPTNLNFKNDLIRLEKRSVQLEQLSILAGIKREASEKKALGLATAKSSRQYRFYDHIPNEEEDDEKHVPVQHPDAAPYRIQLLQDGELTFPVIFLYPESNQSDVIEEFRETDTFYSHFTEMFAANAAWDPQHLYHVDTLDWYFETHVEKYAKVGQELVSCLKSVEASNAPSQNAAHKYVYLTLGDMLRNDKCTIIDGIVQIIVLSRTSSEFSLKYRKEYRKLRN